MDIIPHLFRTEYSKIVAVLCNTFGLEELEAAEDIASETFVAALQTWPYSGIPDRPAAWLYRVAKNKTLNHLRRTNNIRKNIRREWNNRQEDTHRLPDLSEESMKDSQLRMLFAVCDPSLPAEAQIAMALRILCGFGIDEIASAFLVNRETITKRLYRAREKLRMQNIRPELPATQLLASRLPNVLTTIYLLFNEGYYSETNEQVIREELCGEAMQLAHLLTQDDRYNCPEVMALLALMCFQSSRLAARRNKRGELVLYHDQDQSLWNMKLVAKGAEYLNAASKGEKLSRYHLEAGIAYWYTVKEDRPGKWEKILEMYNHLLMMQYSSLAALNRTYALARVRGRDHALQVALKLGLDGNVYYHSLLAWLYSESDHTNAQLELHKALLLAKTSEDRRLMQKRLDELM